MFVINFADSGFLEDLIYFMLYGFHFLYCKIISPKNPECGLHNIVKMLPNLKRTPKNRIFQYFGVRSPKFQRQASHQLENCNSSHYPLNLFQHLKYFIQTIYFIFRLYLCHILASFRIIPASMNFLP